MGCRRSVRGVESHGVVFNLEMHVKCKACPVWYINEIKDMDQQIASAGVSGTIEMSSNIPLQVPSDNAAKMGFEPVHKCATCLAYILFLARFARDTVDQIGAFAGDIPLGIISFACHCTGDSAGLVNDGAISAICRFAGIDCFTASLGLIFGHGWFSDLGRNQHVLQVGRSSCPKDGFLLAEVLGSAGSLEYLPVGLFDVPQCVVSWVEFSREEQCVCFLKIFLKLDGSCFCERDFPRLAKGVIKDILGILI